VSGKSGRGLYRGNPEASPPPVLTASAAIAPATPTEAERGLSQGSHRDGLTGQEGGNVHRTYDPGH
jgi:hypothetical protein